jgi:uncharacterized membrane protein HdeD (DUF308 family)
VIYVLTMADSTVVQPIPPELQIPTVIIIVSAGLLLQLILGYIRNRNQKGESFDWNKVASSVIVGVFSAIILISPQVADLEYDPERPIDLLVTLITLLAVVAGFDTLVKKVVKIETGRKASPKETLSQKRVRLNKELEKTDQEIEKESNKKKT